MGSIRKRGDRYRVEIRHRGFYRSMEFATKAAATRWETKIEADYLAGRRGEPTSNTLRDALEQYSEKVSPTKRGCRWEQVRLTKMARDLRSSVDLPIATVQPKDIAEWRDRRQKEVSDATVNREWNLLRSVFSVARREWRWLSDSPMKEVSRPPPSKPRRRRISDDEVARIYRASGYVEGPPAIHAHRVALAFELAIETGMRAGELRTLEPHQIDIRRAVVRLTETKNGDERDVPLSGRARALLSILAREEGPLLPMSADVMDSMFRRVRDKARITELHFHDSRAEAATRLSKKVDVLALAAILGHRDPKSLMIYYRETAEDIAKRLG